MHSPEGVAARKAKLHAKWDREQKYRVAITERRAAEAEERERKLAAFPDLLAALKAAIEPGSHTPETWDACHAAAVAAIAKAEGR